MLDSMLGVISHQGSRHLFGHDPSSAGLSSREPPQFCEAGHDVDLCRLAKVMGELTGISKVRIYTNVRTRDQQLGA